MGLQSAVANGIVLDIHPATTDPLKFIVLAEPPSLNGHPASHVLPGGDVFNAFDWAVELSQRYVDQVTGESYGTLCTYAFPVADDLYLVGHKLSPFVDPLMGMITGRDYGDRVSMLVQKHLPATFAKIMAGATMEQGSGVMRVRTGADQWFFGAMIRPQQSGTMQFTSEDLDFVRDSAIGILSDASGIPENLPGLLAVYAGPDRVDRVLADVKRVLGLVNNGVGLFNT